MPIFQRILLNEYGNAYDLKVKKLYSTPKIYTANNDLSKRWYVYYSFRNPDTGKLHRQTPIYGGVNRFKTKSERMEILSTFKLALESLLKQGYNPYENPDTTETRLNLESTRKHYTIQRAFELIMKEKKAVLTETSYKVLHSKISKFLHYLENKNLHLKDITSLSKAHILGFLSHMLSSSSASNRNNYRRDISSVLSAMVAQDIIEKNPVSTIAKLSSKPVRNKTYSKDKVNEIFEFIGKNQPDLLLFIKFVSWNFLRPIEVTRLKIQDINIKEGLLTVKAKNKAVKTKIIPSILLEEIKALELHKFPSSHFLFTPEGIPGQWETSESGRREYFTRRFQKIKKALNLGEEYSIYSFRHTFITNLYQNYREELSPFETKSKLMVITGHSSMQALEKYLRDIDAELPEDYSNDFSLNTNK